MMWRHLPLPLNGLAVIVSGACVLLFTGESLRAETALVTLEALKSPLLPGEPIPLRVAIKNESDAETIVSADLDFNSNLRSEVFEVLVARGEGPYERVWDGLTTDPTDQPREIRPHQSLVFEGYVASRFVESSERDASFMSITPEVSSLRVVLSAPARALGEKTADGVWSNERVLTNEIVIQVVAPATPADAEVSALLLELPASLGHLSNSPELRGRLQAAALSPSSAAWYPAQILAEQSWGEYSRLRGAGSAEGVAAKNAALAETLRWLDAADEPANPLRAETVRMKADALLHAGRRDEASAQERRLVAEFPNSAPAHSMRK